MRTSLAVLSFFLVGLGPLVAHADSGFRCRTGRLVSVGDRMNEVRNRCGDPDAVSTRIEKRRIKHKVSRWVNGFQESVIEEEEVEVPLDEWTYDLGPNTFIRYVLFENSSVIDVSTGSYGAK
jgi:hypothetical protein